MMTDDSTVSAEVVGFSPLGEVFLNARNAKNLALKDVSNSLRLSIKQIEALEANDFASLPPAMITRGFIRNYARLLELDAEPLLASYRARVPEALPAALSVQTSMNQVMPSQGNSSFTKYFVIAGLIALSLAAGFYYTNYIQKPATAHDDSSTEVHASQTPAEVVALPEVALPAAERQPQIDGASTEVSTSGAVVDTAAVEALPLEKTNPEAANKAVTTNATEAINKPTQAATPPVSIPAATIPPVQVPKEVAVDFKALKEKATAKQLATSAPEVATNSGLKTDSTIAAIKGVNIAVSEQTWVRVTDKTGAVVFEKMLQPNSDDGFNGLPPFKLLIGNAKATKLTFLGQQVDLTDKTRNNVARVTLE